MTNQPDARIYLTSQERERFEQISKNINSGQCETGDQLNLHANAMEIVLNAIDRELDGRYP